MKRRVSIAAAALVAGGSAVALLLVPGRHAAGRQFSTLRGADLFRPGHTASLAASGRTLVVDLWAGWCGPCRREAPMLEAAARRYPGVRFAGIDVGDAYAAGLRAAHSTRIARLR